jgi:hypothetical protein
VIGYLDCFSGASGDMLLAALVDAGWPADELMRVPATLGLDGVSVRVTRVRRGALDAVRVEVEVGRAQPERHLRQVRERIERAGLSEHARSRSLDVFTRLAEAEAKVHGTTPDQVHFHEVGAADALVDVVGVCLGLEHLRIDALYSSALPLGRGTVQSEHGVLPIPGPATAELLRGVPVEMPDIQAELVTPTGAALLVTLVERWGWCPPFTIAGQGLGAGARDLAEQPNVLRLFLGDAASSTGRRSVVVLETAVDDVSPQFVAPVIARLLAAGARDAFLIPAIMKRSRPATVLRVLAEPADRDRLAGIVFAETSTIGVRYATWRRIVLAREEKTVKTPWGAVRVKVARAPDGTPNVAPEFEDCRRLATERGVPLKLIYQAALAAALG